MFCIDCFGVAPGPIVCAFVNMLSHENFSPVPSLDEQIAAIESLIEGMREAFTELNEEKQEKVTDPDALREIECLEATRSALRRLKAAPSSAAGKKVREQDNPFSNN